MWPDGTSGSRVLIRINVPPYSLAMRSHDRRTVGTACPAPHSMIASFAPLKMTQP